MMRLDPLAPWLVALLLAGGCPKEEGSLLTKDELLDPKTCQRCHASHYEEWSGSMHAYASTDPIFRAMNARGQRETQGQLGSFCVQCHAPMALRLGATVDGLNLDEVPEPLQGVTCYFCHSVDAVEGNHNNPLRLSDDGVMRGGIARPVDNGVHRAAYSPLHDRNRLESATLCGSCHDIMTPSGVHLERTFEEWRSSVFADPDNDGQLSCSRCHMKGRDDIAADFEGVPLRRVHDHSFPGVDVALTPAPEMEAQRAGVQDELDTTLLSQICHTFGESVIEVSLENVAAGHRFPSGAAQDRRAWVEVTAYAQGQVVMQSGAFADDEAISAEADPQLWVMRDRMFDANGEEVHMFWEAASVESQLLPPSTTLRPTDEGYVDPHVTRSYIVPVPVDRITVRVRMRPVDFPLVDELVASGDLDPEVRDAIPTFTLRASELEWRLEMNKRCVPE